MSGDLIRLAHGEAEAWIDPSVGNIPRWQVGPRAPLHAAPWRDEAEVQALAALSPVEKRLAGDFLCMPFGTDDVTPGPIHGPTANAPWEVEDHDVAVARLVQSTGPYGARITKEVRLVGPCLLQTHRIEGGTGAVSFAHHPMARMAEGGRLSFSPKRAILTDPMPQYAGHGLWALNQIRGDLRLDCDDGGQWDAREYPAGHAVEDFFITVEARDRRLGWTVLMRNAEDDMLVVLKDARVMPLTMCWISNGGRDFAPWNGRHTGVIGIEDGCALGNEPLSRARAENRLTAMGVPTVRPLGGRWEIRHAMVSLPRPPGWSEVQDVAISGGQLRLSATGGAEVSVPFPEDHFA